MAKPSYFRNLWFKWKSLKLPWRKKWLCGHDLSGNTFWEFKDPLNPFRPRRIAQYPSTTHYGDVTLTPAWLQWLRHTRPVAPSLPEQQLDMQRQEHMKMLAARADQRWREQESFLDKPSDLGQPQPLLKPRGDQGDGYATGQSEDDSVEGVRSAVGDQSEVQGKFEGKDVDKERFKGDTRETPRDQNPWKKAIQRSPGEAWQPEQWKPSASGRQ